MRVDDAHHILGLRLNDWTSIVVFLVAVAYLVISAKKAPGREEVVEPAAVDDGAAEADGPAEDDTEAEAPAKAKAPAEAKATEKP